MVGKTKKAVHTVDGLGYSLGNCLAMRSEQWFRRQTAWDNRRALAHLHGHAHHIDECRVCQPCLIHRSIIAETRGLSSKVASNKADRLARKRYIVELNTFQRQLIRAAAPLGAQIKNAHYFQEEYLPCPIHVTLQQADSSTLDLVLRVTRCNEQGLIKEATLLPCLA